MDYRSAGGGVVHAEFKSEQEPGVINKPSFEAIAQGFLAAIKRIDIPVERMDCYIKYSDEQIAKFTIETSWTTDYDDGDLQYSAYLERILDSLEMKDSEEPSNWRIE